MENSVDGGSEQRTRPDRLVHDVPYYGQTRRFSCGPSCLIMTMRALAPELRVERALELELWREATTIHGGCGPLGLALALSRRGFAARVRMSHDQVLFASRAKDAVERETMQILQQRDLAEAEKRKIPVTIEAGFPPDLEQQLALGWLPIVAVNIDFEGRNITHWVVVVGYDDQAYYVHDPLVSPASQDPGHEGSALAVGKHEFERWARFGPDRERAVVLAGTGDARAATA